MIQPEFQYLRLLTVLTFFVLGLILSSLFESLFFILFGFWAVLSEQFEEVVGLILLKSGSKLIDLGRNLKSAQ